MKHILSAALLAVGLIGNTAQADDIAGYDRITVQAKHRPAPVAGSIWYPTGTPTYRGLIGDNVVFTGSPAYVGAAVADGKFPLILLSHGSGGNMDAISWISSGLARRGAMVLALNHPGSTSGDSSPRRSVRLGERAADLSAALDTLLADPSFAPHIDTTRITAAGFSLGGTTALNLAGLRFDRDAYRDYCAEFLETALDCVFFAKGGVDFSALPEDFAADATDPRITSAVAIDPGMTLTATADSITRTTLPVLLINLGEKDRWHAVDTGPEGSDLARRLPDATLAVMAPAHHFTFLAVCKPEGASILADEKDDPVCDDPEGTDRAAIHDRIIDQIADFLKL